MCNKDVQRIINCTRYALCDLVGTCILVELGLYVLSNLSMHTFRCCILLQALMPAAVFLLFCLYLSRVRVQLSSNSAIVYFQAAS